MSRQSKPNDRDEPADHSEDPRKTAVGSGGYPEENPAGEGDGRSDAAAGDRSGRSRADGEPGQATGNPRAAGATPTKRR